MDDSLPSVAHLTRDTLWMTSIYGTSYPGYTVDVSSSYGTFYSGYIVDDCSSYGTFYPWYTVGGCSVYGTSSYPWYIGWLFHLRHILPVVQWMTFIYNTSYHRRGKSMSHLTRDTLDEFHLRYILPAVHCGRLFHLWHLLHGPEYTVDDCSIYDTFYPWYTECLLHL